MSSDVPSGFDRDVSAEPTDTASQFGPSYYVNLPRVDGLERVIGTFIEVTTINENEKVKLRPNEHTDLPVSENEDGYLEFDPDGKQLPDDAEILVTGHAQLLNSFEDVRPGDKVLIQHTGGDSDDGFVYEVRVHGGA
jgi:hypothetical protein